MAAAFRVNGAADVSLYRAVRYESVYPGIDIIYYGNQRQLEYDFCVAPGANPKDIRITFDGARSLRLNASGELVVDVGGGQVRQLKPIIYQEVDGVRRDVGGRYVMKGRREVGFEIDAYDTSRPLVIDPVLVYSSYLGGGGTEYGNDIAVDATGNIYVTGWTTSVNFPTRNTIIPPPAPDPFHPNMGTKSLDVFVTKIDPSASGDSTLVYSAYLGGTDSDEPLAVAVDADKNVYITGSTHSYNLPGTPQDESFPVTASAFQSALVFLREGHPSDAFFTKLNAAGNRIVYSSYLGGGGTDLGEDIAVDTSGHAFLTGMTNSFDSDPVQVNDVFPTTPGAYQSTNPMASNGGHESAFVAKFDLSQSGAASLVYSTYLGGSGGDRGYGIAVDANGSALVAGTTTSIDFPTANGFQLENHGGTSGFVSKLNFGGTGLLYSTYVGGTTTCPFSGCATGETRDIAIDSSGKAYITGRATTGLPTTPDVYQPTAPPGQFVPFVAKLDTALIGPASVAYATYLSAGGFFDGAFAIAVDSSGNAYITGETSGPFPTTPDAIAPNHSGNGDAGHHVDENLVVLLAARRETHAAISHHRGRHAVGRRRRHPVRPDGLPVVVGVEVHEAGRHQKPRRVDFAVRVAVDGSDGCAVCAVHRGDHPVGDRDIADERLTAEAVGDGAPANDQLSWRESTSVSPRHARMGP